MHFRISYPSIAIVAALAFSGCEWGGAHENTWNDGYSWANFTGTYRFVKAVYYMPTSSSDSDSDSKQLKLINGFAKEAASAEYSGQAIASMSSSTSAGGSLAVANGLVPGSVDMTVSLKNGGTATIISDSANNLVYKGATVGTVTESGAWHFTLPVEANASEGDTIAVNYKYFGSGDGDDQKPDNAVYLSFLKVTQQGNKLTMIGDSGMVYKGQLTGASTSKDGYVAAQQVRLSFQVTSATGNMTIIGHFSGVWSGAAEKQYGVLSERTIQGTHNRAGNFVGAAADTTIKVPDITISEVGENSVSDSTVSE